MSSTLKFTYRQFRELDSVFTSNLNKVRIECIEVQQALKMITNVSTKIKLLPVLEDKQIPLTYDEKMFYYDILAPYCEAIIEDLVCYGYAISYTQAGIPIRVNPVNAIVTIHGGIRQTLTAVFREDNTTILDVIVSEMPDFESGRSVGALARCQSEYLAGRIIWCNELAIGSSNAQTIYTMARTDTVKESTIMRSINEQHNYAYDHPLLNPNNPAGQAYNLGNLGGASAKQYDKARDAVVLHSMKHDDSMCTDLGDRARNAISNSLSVSHPGIQTRIASVYSHGRPAVFLPVPAGYQAVHKQPTPEMRTMTTLLNEISRSILQAFGVAAARSLSTVQNSSLYHSKAQMDSQDAALQTNVLRLYNIIRVALGDFYLTRHTSKNRKRARAVFDETLSEPDVAVDSVFKIMDAEMPKLGVVLIPNSQQMNGFYDAGFITWKAMQKHLVKSEGFDAADLVEVDPRITAAVKLKSYIPSDTAQSVIE